MNSKLSDSSARASRTALWVIIGGFSIMLAANSALVYFALSTWTGLETKQSFVKGLAYNRNLEGARRQRELGWRMQFETTFSNPDSGVVGVKFFNRDGDPLVALKVKLFAIRPTREGFDREFAATSSGDGAYQIPFTLPLPGVWDMRVVARRGNDIFQRVERIITP